ncbi:MAG: hypothetical protein ONB23_02870 [candidate division KSB1 bacterium]|nr:hypothetical protein [candidate division KSB1 bacterium]
MSLARPDPLRGCASTPFFLLAIWIGTLNVGPHAVAAGEGSPASKSRTWRYQVHYLGMGVGELTVTVSDTVVVNGKRARAVRITMNTGRLASTVFAVQNSYIAVYFPENRHLHAVTKRIHQRNLTGEWEIHYAERQAKLIRPAQSSTPQEWAVSSPCLDVVSLLDLLVNIRHPDTSFTVAIDQEAVPMEAQVRVFRDHERSYALAVFRPAGPSRRTWKTDLLTSRFSRAGARLEVYFDARRPDLPRTIRYSLGTSMATAEWVERD